MNEIMMESRQRWNELKKLYLENDIKEFYRKYAEYLEWNGCCFGTS